MRFPVRTIPDGFKPRDFFVYSLVGEDSYHRAAKIPSLAGQLKKIDVSATGFIRYSMIRLIPIMNPDLLFDSLGGLLDPLPPRRKHGGHELVKPGDYILVVKRLPDGWFGVDFGGVQSKFGVTQAFEEVAEIAMHRWIPYRPDNNRRSRHHWGTAFENEGDAVAFQAHLSANNQKSSASV